MRGSIWAIAAVVTLLAAGCGTATVTTNSTAPSAKATASDNGAKMSPQLVAYMDKAMPKLAKITRLWTTGQVVVAAKLWKSIEGPIAYAAADEVASRDYLKYANNVRYYMIGDGSATLKDVESSREKAQATISDLRP